MAEDTRSCENLTGSDYVDPWYLIVIYILVVGIWLAPQFMLMKMSPNLSRQELKWHWIFAIPGCIFESATSVAALRHGIRCGSESYLYLTGFWGTALILLDVILYILTVRFIRKSPNQESTAMDMDSRIWEVIGPFMATAKGTAIIFVFALGALTSATAAIVGISDSFENNGTSTSDLDDDFDLDNFTGFDFDDDFLTESSDFDLRMTISLAVWFVLFISSTIFFCCPKTIWRIRCCCKKRSFASFLVGGSEERPTELQLARTRYYVARLYLLDLGGFLLNAINGNWIFLFFLFDEMWVLGRVFLYEYMRRDSGGPSDEDNSMKEKDPTEQGGGDYPVQMLDDTDLLTGESGIVKEEVSDLIQSGMRERGAPGPEPPEQARNIIFATPLSFRDSARYGSRTEASPVQQAATLELSSRLPPPRCSTSGASNASSGGGPATASLTPPQRSISVSFGDSDEPALNEGD
mmetsp:Transcript_23095/g.38169  ORF Transcript_23095/g.38169 Transcript_23095/m.38169 type:complete len:465 (+) Transcript_23095:105-1499(+)